MCLMAFLKAKQKETLDDAKVRKKNENVVVNIDVMQQEDKNSSSQAVFSNRKPFHFIIYGNVRMSANELSGLFTPDK